MNTQSMIVIVVAILAVAGLIFCDMFRTHLETNKALELGYSQVHENYVTLWKKTKE